MSITPANIFQWIKLKPRSLVGLGVTCIVILCLPQSWRATLQYDSVVSKYGAWIGIGGLASLVYGMFLITIDRCPQIAGLYREWKWKRDVPHMLRNLSVDEKKFLASYLQDDVITRLAEYGDGVVNSLQMKNIVYRASQMAVKYDEFAFNLKPDIAEVFKSHPDIREDILKHAPAGIRMRHRLG